jgi:hypothetical protein
MRQREGYRIARGFEMLEDADADVASEAQLDGFHIEYGNQSEAEQSEAEPADDAEDYE